MGISRNTTTMQVYNTIKERIISGHFSKKEKLTEQGIARELEVSPTPVREAFNRLTAEGFLESKPYHGVRVKSYSRNDIREAYLIRMKLQSLIYQLLLEKMDDSIEEKINLAYQKAIESDEENIFLRFYDFNTMIFQLANCRIIQENMMAINAIISIDIISRIEGPFDTRKHLEDYKKLIEAIHYKDNKTITAIVERMIERTMNFVLENTKEYF